MSNEKVNRRMQRWSEWTDWETVCRRASGRRRWNALAKVLRAVRQKQMLQFILETGCSLTQRGIQRRLARLLQVSPSTICRDLKGILSYGDDGKPLERCPTCGTIILTKEKKARVDAVLDRHGL